jgi:23S rRNA (pseudouridine1915-N3)-methyltransferase
VKLTILAVGKLRESHYVAACDEYEKRLRRYLPTEVIEVKRTEDLASRRPARAETWALDERGRELSSAELASAIADRMSSGSPGIAFLIGGADGLSDDLRASADRVLSLSRMTLAHRLARLVLLEQLYRSLTIIRGEPYHR